MSGIAIEELHIGFTGSREGLTRLQIREIRNGLQSSWDQNSSITKYFHHGDCVGADSIAHDIAEKIGYVCVVHPPTDDKYRAYKNGIVLPEKDYLARNRDIVDCSHYVMGAPNTQKEVLRSGTWSTIRYARDKQKLWKIIKPGFITTGFKIPRSSCFVE